MFVALLGRQALLLEGWSSGILHRVVDCLVARAHPHSFHRVVCTHREHHIHTTSLRLHHIHHHHLLLLQHERGHWIVGIGLGIHHLHHHLLLHLKHVVCRLWLHWRDQRHSWGLIRLFLLVGTLSIGSETLDGPGHGFCTCDASVFGVVVDCRPVWVESVRVHSAHSRGGAVGDDVDLSFEILGHPTVFIVRVRHVCLCTALNV